MLYDESGKLGEGGVGVFQGVSGDRCWKFKNQVDRGGGNDLPPLL